MEEFVRSAPRIHGDGKNVGYLFALANGTCFVLDFEDDVYLNHLFLWGDTTNVEERKLSNIAVVMLGGNAFNRLIGKSYSIYLYYCRTLAK